MFTGMVSELKTGKVTDLDHLRKRFDRALVKKIGVLKTPYSFWSSDPKINPSAKELFWATILLGDNENYELLKGIIATEFSEKKRASGQSADIDQQRIDISQLISVYLQEFLELAPSGNFRTLLQRKIEQLS